MFNDSLRSHPGSWNAPQKTQDTAVILIKTDLQKVHCNEMKFKYCILKLRLTPGKAEWLQTAQNSQLEFRNLPDTEFLLFQNISV